MIRVLFTNRSGDSVDIQIDDSALSIIADRLIEFARKKTESIDGQERDALDNARGQDKSSRKQLPGG